MKLKKLQERIRRLVNRIDLLSRLLKEANIPIPNVCSWKDFKPKKYKWTGKVDEKNISNNKCDLNEKKNINGK